MMNVIVEGRKYRVIERLGFVHDVGGYVVEVETTDGPRKAIKWGYSDYRFWTARDRVQPMRRERK